MELKIWIRLREKLPDLEAKILMLCQERFGEGNGTPLQYSCLENPMDGGAW